MIFTAFHHSVTSSDSVAGGDGYSSNKFLATSDLGTVQLVMSSNHFYHISQVQVGLDAAADDIGVSMITMASNSLDTDGNYTMLTPSQHFTTPTNKTGIQFFEMNLTPPVFVQYNSDEPILSVRIGLNASDTPYDLMYSGFTTPAPRN